MKQALKTRARLWTVVLLLSLSCRLLDFLSPAYANTQVNTVIPSQASPTVLETLQISEVYPVPQDGYKEYVEIFNPLDTQIDLSEYSLYDVSSPSPGSCENESFLLALSGAIEPNQYIAFELGASRLNNNGDRVILRQASEPLQNVDELTYGVCGDINAQKGRTIGRKHPENTFFDLLSPTPSGENYLLELSEIAVSGDIGVGETIGFSSGYDGPDEAITSRVWSVNGGVVEIDTWSTLYQIDSFGEYVVSLEAVDIYQNAALAETEFAVDESTPIDYTGLVINEVFPSPSTGDEWVELYNASNAEIILEGVWLDDILDGGSAAYEFSEDAAISARGYLVIPKTESGIAFNNGGDDVALLSPEQDTIDLVSYPSVARDLAYALYEGEWYLTENPTPGEQNIVPTNDDPQDTVITIAEAKNMIGEVVFVEGVVTSATGEVSNGVAYIQDSSGGLRIKTTDDYSRGEHIRISGEMHEAWGETYLSAETSEMLAGAAIPEALILAPRDVSVEALGKLVKIEGIVVKTQSGTFWVSDEGDDSATAEVKVYLSKSLGWERPEWIKKGANISVVGVLSQWGFDDSGEPNLRILPRDENDLVALGEVLGVSGTDDNKASVLPETSGALPLLPGVLGCSIGLLAKVAWTIYHKQKKHDTG